jgi:hypothetical protein
MLSEICEGSSRFANTNVASGGYLFRVTPQCCGIGTLNSKSGCVEKEKGVNQKQKGSSIHNEVKNDL